MKTILIANRGEIAIRVIHAARDLGIRTVAVYSSADRDALHLSKADSAYLIGPANPSESYLDIDRIIDAAERSGADAIHPGYGFLAENERFARRVEQAGLIFIGPKATTIAIMGNKIASRNLMIEHGVPVLPGYHGSCDDHQKIIGEAEKIGYPVIVKAAAGGGGKGMQIVRSKAELAKSIESARRVAKQAFGDSTVYLERYIERPRHIEFQVLADLAGNTVHLFERECSIQRRHQKIVEETPSVVLTDELRDEMGNIARKAAKAVNYCNAGTVEFLYENNSFYFLEMNTRIQVEHPITELVTGVDLVKWQLKIARGETLDFRQEDLRQHGHAIECRVYAEDPEQGFLPSPGKILHLIEPSGPGVRNDNGFLSGAEISAFYDSMISKLICHGRTRTEAIERMLSALDEYVILGIKTTIPFLKAIMTHEAFVKGDTTTSFIPEYFEGWKERKGSTDKEYAMIAATLLRSYGSKDKTTVETAKKDLWTSLGPFRN